ncbi:MAG: TlpA family protein disulfide reductase [Tannerella sp.]|jgi:thiol-disulfide isomerase/thioredoxin|nr:TlpA family protein disulfide reductase [Tannerella sp.]
MNTIKTYLSIVAGAALLLLSGCKSQTAEEAYQACLEAEKNYNAAAEKLSKAAKDGTLTAELETSLTEESNALFEGAKATFSHFFEEHINTAYAQKIFSESRWVRRLNQDQLEAVVKKVEDATFKETEVFKNAADRLKYMKMSSVGNPYINIISRDTIGNQVELAQFVGKGKYVLIDFWASWCPDCRKEMPDVVELYNQFKDKDFEMIGYSLDREEDAWKKGINDLNITWAQMSDLSYWNSPGVQFYSVQWIPTNILIDPDGKIIARGLSVEDLKLKLNELL